MQARRRHSVPRSWFTPAATAANRVASASSMIAFSQPAPFAAQKREVPSQPQVDLAYLGIVAELGGFAGHRDRSVFQYEAGAGCLEGEHGILLDQQQAEPLGSQPLQCGEYHLDEFGRQSHR